MTIEIDGFEVIERVNDYWIDERGEEIRIIEQDINDIHDIMAEMNGLVEQQGPSLDRAAASVQSAKAKTSQANAHLKEAKSIRKKRLNVG